MDYAALKQEVFIVTQDINSFFPRLYEKRGLPTVSAYKKNNIFFRVLRRLHFKSKLPGKFVWYNNEVKKLPHYSTIIIFDPVMTDDFVKWLKRVQHIKRIIFWYWNPVRNSIDPRLLTEDICEKWSYSPCDCKNFGLKYNTTFYFKELRAPEIDPVYDIFFVGKDKGRLTALLNLKNQFEVLNLKTRFHITPTRQYQLKSNPIYRKPLSYDDVLLEIGRSKAILDFLSDPSDGLSLRPMESIFLKRKLITNSLIIADYDFYRPNNIFILGRDDPNDLPDFLNSPYEEIENDTVMSYDFECWLQRFQIN